MIRYASHLLFALFLLLSVFWVLPAYHGMMSSMNDASQHMEYVWLVPVLSALLLWFRRREILASFGRPEPWLALPFFLLAAAFLFLGFRGGQDRFLQSAAVLILLALPLACYGWRTFTVVWFPILLLAFVMPIGFLDNFTVPLRRASVGVTAVLLNGLGIGVEQVGTAIYSTGTPPFKLDVADPCSGIRSIVALFAGTAAYGAFMLRSVPRRWILFLSSVPIAFLGNILRLLLTAIASHLISQHAGMMLHDNALFVVAPFYALCVFALAERLKRNDSPAKELRPGIAGKPSAFSWALLAFLLVFLPTFRGYVGQTPELTFESDAFLRPELPQLADASISYPIYCQNRQCLWTQHFAGGTEPPQSCPVCSGELRRVSRAELDILPADTQSFKATYTFSSGAVFTVSRVIAGRNRMSIHRPELCLPAQGFSLSERQIVRILPDVSMACFSLRHPARLQASGFAYLFLNSGGTTVSNLERVVGDSLERSLHNRIRRWAMITVSSAQYDFCTPEGEAALRKFMEQLYPELWSTPPCTNR